MTWTDPPLWVASARLYDYQLNPHVRGNLLFLKECTALGAAEEVQIAGDAAIITQSYIELEAESGTADDLDTISPTRAGLGEGTVIILIAKDGHTITVKNGANIPIGNDVVLIGTPSGGNHLALIRGPVNWHLLYSPTDVTFCVNAFQYPVPATEWGPTSFGAHLPVAQTAAVTYLPLNFLKIGDVIISYKLIGDMIVAGTSTLDCKLVRVNLSDPITTTDITNGAIGQQTADGDFDVAATVDDETVATDKMYYLLITGTTDAADQIYVMGAEVVVRRLI